MTLAGGYEPLSTTSHAGPLNHSSPIHQRLLSNKYILICALLASIGGLTFGYDQGVIANVLVMKSFVGKWPVGAWEKGVITAALELGALFGALAAGITADRYSRRHSIFLASVLFLLGSALQSVASSLSHLILGRALGGVGVGGLSMLSPLYISEISPPSHRGSLMALEQLSIVAGVVLGFWCGFWTRNLETSAAWRIPLAIQIFPGLLLAVGCLWLPPSPRLLVLRGKPEEALNSLRRLRNLPVDNPEIQMEFREMRIEAFLIQHQLSQRPSLGKPLEETGWWRGEWRAWRKLGSDRWRGRTVIGVGIMVFQQWSGINALLYYGPILLRPIFSGGNGGDDKITLLVSGGIGIVQLIAVGPAILLIDRWGRKPLLRGGSTVMAGSHLIIALLAHQFGGNWERHAVAAWGAVACIYTFTFAYGTSYGPVAWVLPSEVFPLSMRSKGVAVSTGSNWLNNFLIGLLTPRLMEMSVSATFLMFSVCTFCGYLFSTYIVPETAGVSLEEMDEVFGGSVGREEAELRNRIAGDLVSEMERDSGDVI